MNLILNRYDLNKVEDILSKDIGCKFTIKDILESNNELPLFFKSKTIPENFDLLVPIDAIHDMEICNLKNKSDILFSSNLLSHVYINGDYNKRLNIWEKLPFSPAGIGVAFEDIYITKYHLEKYLEKRINAQDNKNKEFTPPVKGKPDSLINWVKRKVEDQGKDEAGNIKYGYQAQLIREVSEYGYGESALKKAWLNAGYSKKTPK